MGWGAGVETGPVDVRGWGRESGRRAKRREAVYARLLGIYGQQC